MHDQDLPSRDIPTAIHFFSLKINERIAVLCFHCITTSLFVVLRSLEFSARPSPILKTIGMHAIHWMCFCPIMLQSIVI